MSLEEEQARQRAAESATSGSQATPLPPVAERAEGSSAGGLAGSGSLVAKGAESILGEGANADDESEEAMLQKAIALSQGGGGDASTKDEDVDMDADESDGTRAIGKAFVAGRSQGDDDEEMDEDEAIARAIEMSLAERGDDEEDDTNKK